MFHCILASVLIVSCFITMVYVIYNISGMSRTRLVACCMSEYLPYYTPGKNTKLIDCILNIPSVIISVQGCHFLIYHNI